MDKAYVCLSPDPHTGDEAAQTVAVCPEFQPTWTAGEIAAAGYVSPWSDPSSVPIRGFKDAEAFEPFHGPAYPGAPGPSKKWRHEKRKVFISDIFRSVEVHHTETYTYQGLQLSRHTVLFS